MKLPFYCAKSWQLLKNCLSGSLDLWLYADIDLFCLGHSLTSSQKEEDAYECIAIAIQMQF